MKGKTGPFPIIDDEESSADTILSSAPRSKSPFRRYDCKNYERCLNLAAALNWNSFTCEGCCGDIDETLQWRAIQEQRQDELVEAICDLPAVTVHRSNFEVARINPSKATRSRSRDREPPQESAVIHLAFPKTA